MTLRISRGLREMADRQQLAGMLLAAAALAGPGTPARADLHICNRMSYVAEVALALEDDSAVATRGWFRIDPGQCRAVLQGAIEAQRILVHADTLPLYGAPPLPQSGHADLCVTRGNFVIAAARVCRRADQRLARFTEVKPSDSELGQTVNLAEEAQYDDAQARLAGIQRLLVLAGYDANPIDGIQGKKTESAIGQFLRDRKLPAESVTSDVFFDTLVEAAQRPDGFNLTWCNETPYAVMAALGVENRGTITTRGWFRVEAGRCLRPELHDNPRRVYSYAEAIDGNGHVLMHGGKRLTWGGDTMLCTRSVRFEINDHGDCHGMGLTPAGFTTIDTGRPSSAVRFALP